MTVLTVAPASESVQLGIGAPAATDNYKNGVLTDATDVLNRATLSAGTQWNGGIFRTDAGQIQYVDATAGLPAGTVWVNGLPYSGTALCIAISPVATYSNGIPMAANGAVCAGIVP